MRELAYKDKHQMENLYFLIYYDFVDSNERHFMTRVAPRFDDLNEEEMAEETASLIKHVMKSGKEFNTFNKVMKACDALHDNRVAKAVDNIRKMFLSLAIAMCLQKEIHG